MTVDDMKSKLRTLPKLAGSLVTIPKTYYGIEEGTEFPYVAVIASKHPQLWLDKLSELTEENVEDLTFSEVRNAGKKKESIFGETTNPLASASDAFVDVESEAYAGTELCYYYPDLPIVCFTNGYDKS